MTAERAEKCISLYENAIVFKLNTLGNVIIRDDKNQENSIKLINAYRKITEICNKIESTAFYNGDYLAVSFAAGSCRHFFCYGAEKCAVLDGRSCINYYRTRPSMESVGIDCFKLAAELGWDIIPVGNSVKAEYISHGTLMGLILIN
jgi:predicted metal-binding protein